MEHPLPCKAATACLSINPSIINKRPSIINKNQWDLTGDWVLTLEFWSSSCSHHPSLDNPSHRHIPNKILLDKATEELNYCRSAQSFQGERNKKSKFWEELSRTGVHSCPWEPWELQSISHSMSSPRTGQSWPGCDSDRVELPTKPNLNRVYNSWIFPFE